MLAPASAPQSVCVGMGGSVRTVARNASLFAEISEAHLGVLSDLLGGARDYRSTGHQYGDPVRDRKHRLDIVLDEQDGMRALQVSHEIDHQPGFVSPHSGQRFVKKEELWPRCDGH